MEPRPTVTVLLPERTRAMVLDEPAELALTGLAEVKFAAGPPDTWDLDALTAGAVACVTGWGTPPLPAELFDRVPDLALVAHTAGSIRRLVPSELVGTRVVVCQAAAVIARSVAELVILQALSQLRELHLLDAGLRSGAGWGELRERHPGRLLGNLTVGVIGASRTGRAVIELLGAFGSSVLVADPTLDDTDAAALGQRVRLTELDVLLAGSDVVTLHAPLLPSTEHLLGATELGRLRDGAVLINSARGGLIEPDALAAELRSGRLRAALDVFPTEPLAPVSPWRQIPNALISPHTAGHTLDSHLEQGAAMVAEVGRFLRGEPLHYEVSSEAAEILA